MNAARPEDLITLAEFSRQVGVASMTLHDWLNRRFYPGPEPWRGWHGPGTQALYLRDDLWGWWKWRVPDAVKP